MAASVEYYDELIDAFGDPEALTLLVVAGASRETVARALEVDLHAPVGHPWDDRLEHDYASWALVEIDGGVLGVEHTGYADLPAGALDAMSSGGGTAAVVRSNFEPHLRFGCEQEVHVDDLPPGDPADVLVAGLARAEAITGLELTAEHAMLLAAAQFFKGPADRNGRRSG